MIVPLLVLIGLAGDRLTRPRYLDAIDGVELAARNVVRTEARNVVRTEARTASGLGDSAAG